MNGRQTSLWSPAIGAEGRVITYGHWGRPLLAFPSQEGPAWQYEERGMVDAVAELIEAGRVKIYAVDSFDSDSWYRQDVPLEKSLRRRGYDVRLHQFRDGHNWVAWRDSFQPHLLRLLQRI